jgi:hypothetical protein
MVQFTQYNTVTCRVVHATNMTGSSLDDGIYYQFGYTLLFTLTHRQYSTISVLHQLLFTVAHALGFYVSTSRFLAMDLNTQTVTVLHSKYYT